MVPDIEYLNPSNKDAAVAKAVKLRDFPNLDQVRVAIALMPIDTVVERRNRAVMALAILTGIRDRALISLSLRHIDMGKVPPLIRQEAGSCRDQVRKEYLDLLFPRRRRLPSDRRRMGRGTANALAVRAKRSALSPDENGPRRR